MATESTPATLSDLVPELHALILANLPYKHLLCAKRVAKNWKAIIESDPTLQVQTFKKASSVHIDNGVVEVDEYTIQRDSEPMTIHPALQEMCWHFGEAVSDARFYLGSNLDPYLASAGVLDDLATIPAVHTFKTTMREDMFSPVIFVQNDQGITKFVACILYKSLNLLVVRVACTFVRNSSKTAKGYGCLSCGSTTQGKHGTQVLKVQVETQLKDTTRNSQTQVM
ncbi:hypothetical protein FB45DRAFT_1006003 [Roridomyces roridus]|uniref:F-box domain-containing protein n=1 Tax=Roridomyces roridus TaxID=1738132 RepID=A0AAD7BKD0_9AGAR|nr:hypothetical protein FB45DRAFT_1006003 [Roridomyces roridus]